MMRRAQVPLQRVRSRSLGQQGRSLQRSQLPRQPARSLRKLLGAPKARRRDDVLKTVCQGSYAAALSCVAFSGELEKAYCNAQNYSCNHQAGFLLVSHALEACLT